MSTPGAGTMIVGGLVCAAGLAVTSISAAAAGGGGRYVFAWGAILFGATAFFRGLMTYGNHVGTGAPGDAATSAPPNTRGTSLGTGAPGYLGTTMPLVVKYGNPVGNARTENAGAGPAPAQLRTMTELSAPERILAEALAGVVRHAAAITAPELAAIHSVLRSRPGATVSEF